MKKKTKKNNISLAISTLIIAAGLGYSYIQGDTKSLDKWKDEASNLASKLIENGSDSRITNHDIEKKKSSNARKLELPAALEHTPELIINHIGYIVSFNREHNNPNWSAWELTAEETDGNEPREDIFLPDPNVPEPHRVTTDDYKGSGYDRGHMCPAADMKWSQEAMHDCFYMTNICPQTHSLNSGGWQVLESACRRWARQEGSIYIICGPVYNNTRKHKTIGTEHKITIPTGFFKCILSTRPGHEKAIGFYYTNRQTPQKMEDCAISVDSIETLTGMNFFVNLDKVTEKRVEASCDLKEWK